MKHRVLQTGDDDDDEGKEEEEEEECIWMFVNSTHADVTQ